MFTFGSVVYSVNCAEKHEPIKSIHVGVGGRGVWPIDLAADDENWQPVALVDINEEFLRRARERTGLDKSACFSSLEEAARQVEADAAIICTPTVMHAPFAQIGFAAGLAVLVEKGMTTDLGKAKNLVKEAEERGLAFCVAQNYRFQSVEQTVKHHLDDQMYGKPAIVDLFHHRYRPNPRTLNYPNAMVWDMSCHHFDNLIFWLGKAKTVIARTYNPPWSRYEYDSGVTAIIEFESSIICNYCLTHCAQNGFYHLLMQTDAGTLRAYDVSGIEFQPIGKERQSIQLLSVPSSEQSVLNAFRDYIRQGIEPGISGRNNLNVMALCQAVCVSAEKGKPVTVAELLD
ncbi:Gfo/Idh/MocA family oxidoreductase [bacterium]|nr:Gfo/Idh/MocA family oxidoreductase [bacterium]